MASKALVKTFNLKAKAAKKEQSYPRRWDPKTDSPIPDECLQIYAIATRGQSGASVEAKQLLTMISELRWHRERLADGANAAGR